ncbi:MAG TPA: 2-oxo acid dehydrogenase subunit E2 [Lacipirellulaceae bacterium]
MARAFRHVGRQRIECFPGCAGAGVYIDADCGRCDAFVASLRSAITYDHRAVDDTAAARFLNDVKGYFSGPGRLLLTP